MTCSFPAASVYVFCTSRMPWYKWNFSLSHLRLNAASLSLPPPVPRSLCLRVSHPSSSSAHPIIKSFSSCFPKSRAPLLSRTSSSLAFFFSPSLLFLFSRLGGGDALPCWKGSANLNGQHGAGLYVHYFIYSHHSCGVTGQNWFVKELWRLYMKEGDSPLIYAMLSLTLGFVV